MTVSTAAAPTVAPPTVGPRSDEVSLGPWAAPPDLHLLSRETSEFWREHRLLPLGRSEGAVLVAAAHDVASAVARRLRTGIAEPVRLVRADPHQIDFWLDIAQGRHSWPQAVAVEVGALLNRLGLNVAMSSAPPDDEIAGLSVRRIEEAFGVAESVALETLALYAGLPQLGLARYTPEPWVGELLERSDAEALQVAPLWARRGLAIVASPQLLAPASVARIRACIGLELRLTLCTPSAFTDAFAAAYPAVSAAPGARISPAISSREPDQRIVLTSVARQNATVAARLDAVLGIARATGEDPLTAIVRLGYASELEVQRARGAALGMRRLAADRPRPHEELCRRGAPALWRRWRAVPVEESRNTVTVASDTPSSPRTLEAMARLLGAAEVSVRYVESAVLDLALHHLPEPHADPLEIEELLVQLGGMPAERLAVVRRRAEREHVPLPAALAAVPGLSPEVLVEARALAAGCAWVTLSRYGPSPDAQAALSEGAARAAWAAPLVTIGPAVAVALLDLGGARDLEELRRQARLPLVPVLAVVDDPEAALARWFEHRGSVPKAYEEFGRFLVRRGLLDRAQVDRALEQVARSGRPLDEALVERELLTPERLAAAFSEHRGFGQADLEPRQRRTQVIGALGDAREEIVWEDPIDRAVARPLGAKPAADSAIIPVRIVGAAVEVAFANPLDDAAVAVAEAALSRPVRVLVATRRAIELAHRRTYASKSLGERLLQSGLITQDQLARAVRVHDETGVRIGSALLSLGIVNDFELAAVLAEQADLPFIDLRSIAPEPDVARLLAPDVAQQRGVLPLFDDGEAITVGFTDPPEAVGLEAIGTLLGRPVRPVMITETCLDDALDALYREEYHERSATQLVYRSPDDSARWVLIRSQKIFFIALIVVALISLALAPVFTATLFVVLSTAFYVAFSAYKFYLAYKALSHTLEVEMTDEEVRALDERDLPVYTILVPLYREAEVLPILVRAIARMDYPKPKLDVKILLEQDDVETIAVARRSRLPSHFKLVIVPNGIPKGKPKACNYGLIHADGEFVVIYDAEDIPEADQLRKALVAFRKGPEKLACVQAKLNYFNRDQNLLTRWFTTEYSMWFDLFLPGLDASGAPIPLGGTSNHFRTARLRELGAWDPYNVTEDADLGIRLFKAGWKTAVIDSTTYEEANSEVYNWIRQRSRWVKGYVQTYLVHMRHPLRLWRALGPRGFISFQFVVGGTFFGFLINPVYWILTALWFLTKWDFINQLFPSAIFYVGIIGLYIGNFAFTYLNVAGCLRRGYYDMVKYALLSPIYWSLMSVAAWKGFLQLFYKPSYWEKTNHGLFRGADRFV